MKALKAVLGLFVCCAGSSSFVANALADETEARDAIVKLLEVGWKTTPQARIATNAQYVEVLKIAPADPRATRAAALVLMQQRRYDDAPRQIDAILEREPADVAMWRAKAWVSTILKNYPQTLLAADKLSQLLPEEMEVSTESEIAAREYVAFLGRIFGFLSGPLVETANQELRKAAEKKVLARLSASRQTTFEEARDGVLQKFLEMTDAKNEKKEQVKVAAEAEKEKTLQDVAGVREKNAKRLEDLKYQRDKVRSELNAELNEIMKADQPLVSELSRLNANASSIQQTLFRYDNEIGILQSQLAREKDPNLKNLILNQIDAVQFQYNRVQNNLAAVNRQAQGVANQRQQLAVRQQQAQNNFGGQLVGLDKEYQDLQKSEKRASADEKRANKPVSTTTGGTLALGAAATALSTYDQFPLEEAKAQLLEALR